MTKKATPAGSGRAREEKTRTVHKYSPLPVARQLLDYFRGRDDEVAFGDSAYMRREHQTRPLTPEDLAEHHLGGRTCLGLYPLLRNDRVWLSCLDFDNKPDKPDPQWRKRATRVHRCLRQRGVNALAEISQGGRGGHLWIFFATPVPAWLVRTFWLGLLRHLTLPVPEIFPRQDSLKGKTVGNAIRFPLFNRSHFVDPVAGWTTVPPLKALCGVQKISAGTLKKIAKRLGFQLKRPNTGRLDTVSAGGATNLPHRVHQLLVADPQGFFARRWNGDTEGLQDRSRSALVWSIACNLIWAYVPTNEIEAAIRHWCQLHGYEKGRRDDWIQTTIDGAYDRIFHDKVARKTLGPATRAWCGASGPVARAFLKQVTRKLSKGGR